ncbi:hypothetical protein GCM10027612_13920 [Microbispora bryophytorum subsp. camponoti]
MSRDERVAGPTAASTGAPAAGPAAAATPGATGEPVPAFEAIGLTRSYRLDGGVLVDALRGVSLRIGQGSSRRSQARRARASPR